ncbi:methyltransferase [Trinickia violacea]|uniref:Methyltransferase n=1 Tax=Trinickia violacea TaxID=2571746 RepID=A0A4P8J295_9BURK|nr:protein-glutamate O-methyltransferase CheR [Trinickia violacea]QCP55057.1 methyltransferase [Trinickia violacea]
MDAAHSRYETWLARETGIDASTLGVRALSRAVQERARLTQAPDEALDAYYQLLIASPEERQALIETLVVPETWFFRDSEAFAALARLAAERLVREPARVLRVLSAPCSTGEEPYSIAMALLDAGIGAERFTVDAVDISERALAHARTALYGRNSFRGRALDFRARHFGETQDGWLLNERIRQTVRFTRVNLFDATSSGDASYDFIFCRNMLIYFGRDAQDHAIRRLNAQLAPGGTIFVGPAETGLMMRHPLSSARIPLAFAFQRAIPEEAAARAARVLPLCVPVSVSVPTARSVVPPEPALPLNRPRQTAASAAAPLYTPPRLISPRVPVARQTTAPPQSAANQTATLDDAQRCADAGRLDEAEILAHAVMKQHGPHADAFYLLGLIADAQNRSAEAREHYRKALYLEPAHYEALTHLAALLDMIGDAAGAQQLMRRVERAKPRANATSGTRESPVRTP